MQIRPVVAELYHADRQTGMTKPVVVSSQLLEKLVMNVCLFCFVLCEFRKQFSLHKHGCQVTILCAFQTVSIAFVVLLKLLSARGTAAATLRIATLNVTHDDAKCQNNRPLYVLTQSETQELKKVSF